MYRVPRKSDCLILQLVLANIICVLSNRSTANAKPWVLLSRFSSCAFIDPCAHAAVFGHSPCASDT